MVIRCRRDLDSKDLLASHRLGVALLKRLGRYRLGSQPLTIQHAPRTATTTMATVDTLQASIVRLLAIPVKVYRVTMLLRRSGGLPSDQPDDHVAAP